MNGARMLHGVPGAWHAELRGDALQLVHVDARGPRSRLAADGYGETGTRYRVTLADGRTRRVYARTYGNGAALGVYVDGVWVAAGVDAEAALDTARDRSADELASAYPVTYARHELQASPA